MKYDDLTPEQRQRLDQSADPMSTALDMLRQDPGYRAMTPEQQSQEELALVLSMKTNAKGSSTLDLLHEDRKKQRERLDALEGQQVNKTVW